MDSMPKIWPMPGRSSASIVSLVPQRFDSSNVLRVLHELRIDEFYFTCRCPEAIPTGDAVDDPDVHVLTRRQGLLRALAFV